MIEKNHEPHFISILGGLVHPTSFAKKKKLRGLRGIPWGWGTMESHSKFHGSSQHQPVMGTWIAWVLNGINMDLYKDNLLQTWFPQKL